MILILGGTTEGRMAARVADEAGSRFYYSTKGTTQLVVSQHGIQLTGGMDVAQMQAFCTQHAIRLLVDAAHPFATQLHQTVAETAQSLGLPVVRVERIYPERSERIIWCQDFSDAIRQLEVRGVERLLALTGVQTLARLRPFWERHACWFRILQREESLRLARSTGFDTDRLLYYQEGDEDALFRQLSPDAILTKESGLSGGFQQKVEAAERLGIPVFAICRPSLPDGFIPVTGEHGLRKEIERWVPDFFPLRSGFTTGACATAAAKAALCALVGQGELSTVPIIFPDGETLSLPVASVRIIDATSATAVVIKDAGDDPDVTNGHAIVVTVRLSDEPGIRFRRGEGVGEVTLPGLGIAVGEPAINRVPREMITRELTALTDRGVEVTVAVPGGEELASRTFNPKLGIVGGISIIGTSGIVRPFSHEAFVQAIRKEIEVSQAIGAPRLVLNSGAKSEQQLKQRYSDLPPQAFVHYGNYIGATLQMAYELGVKRVTLGIMLGKAVKLAEGHLDTHSKRVVMNKCFLHEVAQAAGCSSETHSVIDRIVWAKELWSALPATDAERFFEAIRLRCYLEARRCFPEGELTLWLLRENGSCF